MAWKISEIRLRGARLGLLSLGLGVAGLGSISLVPPAVADGLFRPTPRSEQQVLVASAAKKSGVRVLRKAFLILDPSYLRSHVVPRGTKGQSNTERTASASRLTPDLKMQVFPNVTLEFRRTGVLASSESPDSLSWAGWAKNPRKCDIEIVIQSGVLSADAYCPDVNKAYFINQVDGDRYQVVETVMPQVPDEGDDTFNPNSPAPQQRRPQAVRPSLEEAAAPTSVKVLIVRVERKVCSATDEPLEEMSMEEMGIGAAADPVAAQFTQANGILARSGANFRISNVGLLDLSDNCDHMAAQTVLTRARLGTSPFEDVPAYREEYSADLVSVWYAPNNNVCGLANSSANPSSSTSNLAFSMANVAGVGCKFTFLHELSHNFGARHDRFELGGVTNPNVSNFGYVNVGDKIYTLMAYNKQCAANGVACTRVGYISTPNMTTTQGYVLGIAPPDPEAAFNVKQLNAQSADVANYR
jgi:hypothetical protein